MQEEGAELTLDMVAGESHGILRRARGLLRSRPPARIVYPELGKQGRLGNQLWQIASTLGIAARRKAEARFNPWEYQSSFSVPSHFFAPDANLTSPGSTVVEAWTVPTHIAEPFRIYLQDVSLFQPIASTIRRYFSLERELIPDLEAKFAQLLATPKKCAVHVRRTDYVENPEAFVTLDEDYYRGALSGVGDAHVLVFSDDLGWCRDHLDWARPTYVEGNADHEDLFLMTRCERHVIANSSFSWWGAWLSGDPHPVYPRNWYGPGFRGLGIDYTLMIPKGWIGVG